MVSPRRVVLGAVSIGAFAAAMAIAGFPLEAQQAAPARQASAPAARALTAADYARAEKMLAPALTGLVVGGNVAPTWLGRGANDRFTYRTTAADGTQRDDLRGSGGEDDGIVCAPTNADCAAPADAGRAGRGGGRGARCRPWRRTRRRRSRRRRPPTASRSRLARRHARRVRPRLESLGARHGHAARRKPLTTDGVEVLRLRHRQRRLEQQRPRDRSVVAGLEEDRDAAAGRAQGRRDVSRQHDRRPSDAARGEVPAARRSRDGDDPPRRHRRRRRAR